MKDSLASLRNRAESAQDLQAVVRTMKALSASNITQYEHAVAALKGYYRTVELGLMACLQGHKMLSPFITSTQPPADTLVVIFGTDQGLVGRFNDNVLEFVLNKIDSLPGSVKVWAVGERMRDHLLDTNITLQGFCNVPNSVSAITGTVAEILSATTENWQDDRINPLYLFHQRPGRLPGQYEPVNRRLLPLDADWQTALQRQKWPHNNLPQTLGNEHATLSALLREYLFVCLYQSCAESLASENASRLAAMQRADKNIDDMLDNLNHAYHQQRQNDIDSELFDVIASFTEE